MKTIWTLILGLFLTANVATAQDTLYVYKAGAVLYKQAVTGVDSVTFYKNNNTVTDIDGNVYKTVTIGTKTWMAENLKVTHYRDGTALPNVTSNTSWQALTSGAYCIYNNDAANDAKWGKLYNWYAASDSRNLAPVGWHVPSDAEWTTLTNYVGAHLGTSLTTAKALAATTDWTSYSTAGTIGSNLSLNNYSGFSALPGGNRRGDDGTSASTGIYGYWWTTNVSSSTYAYYLGLTYNGSYGSVTRSYTNKTFGFNVRCVKD